MNTNLKTDKQERKTLQVLDAIIRQKSVSTMIDSIVLRVEQKLTQDPETVLAWEPIPLVIYGQIFPEIIRSSWVFVIHAQANTGAERHPNSHQRMMSYRGSGDIQIWNGQRWCSNHLVSDSDTQIENRWISIPPYTWHRAVVAEENWVVVSFQTVSEDKLIEERPDATDTELIRQRRYLE